MKFDKTDIKLAFWLCFIVIILLTFGKPLASVMMVIASFLFSAVCWIITATVFMLAALFAVKLIRTAVLTKPEESVGKTADFINDGETSTSVDEESKTKPNNTE